MESALVCEGSRSCSKLFEVVLVSGSCRVFTHHKIFDCNDALYAAHTRHFSEHSLWIFTMMQRKAGDNDIELLLLERKMLSISKLKSQVRELACLAFLFCNR